MTGEYKGWTEASQCGLLTWECRRMFLPLICWGDGGDVQGGVWFAVVVGEVGVLFEVQCRCVLEYLVPYVG